MMIGAYEIIAEIGVGGMGTVYRGVDKRTNQIVAIKNLKAELAEPEFIERFRREGEALRELNHPNIVKLLDTFEANGQHYLVMEYVAGGDLHNLLQSGVLPVKRVLEIALDVADALTRAHRLNIIHRDLKPGNVLIDADGRPRLSDFGVAHIGQAERVTGTGMTIGTLDYLAPETLSGEAADERTDIWAFGVMLFEMLAGKRPFLGSSLAETVMQIITMPTPDLEKLRDDAPVALVDLVYRMLEKNRDARIRSVRQVGLELESILRGDAPERFATPTPFISDRPRHNLPAQTTEFVGREHELSELAKLIDNPKTRLVTILAPGGMGKTRLALEAAERALLNFGNGVYFVDLAPLSDPANMVVALADALDFQLQAGERTPEQQILDYLAHKHLLLIMDNYEHVLAGGGLVANMLKAAPQIQILVTTRQRLNQTGETIFNLEGMDFPDWETPEDALEYAAVKLFMQSARRVRPDFELTLENMDFVARICKLVLGMPLGILLAASWLGMLSPQEIAQEIEKSIDFLAGDMADLPERQRSIRAVFDYSWQLMSEAEQQVFMKLSVFRGGFTRESAEVVAGANLYTLAALVMKSMLQRSAESGRFEIHELTRQYGEERLKQSGEAENTRHRHLAYYADFVEQQIPQLKGHGIMAASKAVIANFENIRAAWTRAVDTLNVDALGRMCDLLMLFCFHFGRVQDAASLLAHIPPALRVNGNTRSLWGRLTILKILCAHQLDAPARDAAEDALRLIREYGQPVERMIALLTLNRLEISLQNTSKAVEYAMELAEISQDVNEPYFLIVAYFHIAAAYSYSATNLDEQFDYYQRTLALSREIGALVFQAGTLQNLTGLYLTNDNLPEAEQLNEESARIREKLDDRINRSWNHLNRGLYAWHRGNIPLFESSTESLSKPIDGLHEPQLVALSPVMRGMAAAIKEDYTASLDYCLPHLDHFAARGLALLGVMLASCGLRDFETARKMNRLLIARIINERDWASIAADLSVEAAVLANEGQNERAVELLALALTYPKTTQRWLHQWPLMTRLREQLERELGTAAYEAAWERGKMLDPQAVAKELLGE